MLVIFSMLLTVFLPSTAFAEDVAENLEQPAVVTEPQDNTAATEAVDVTLTMAKAVVTEEEVREKGLTLTFTPESGYQFDTEHMSWADGTTPAGQKVTFMTENVGTAQKEYVDTALAAATATVKAEKLTITVPAFDSAFTNFTNGATSGDITIKVSLPAESVSLTDGSAPVEASLVFADNAATIQEIKAKVYVVDGSDKKVDLKESDIRNGEERYIVIEQQGNAGGGSRWTLFPSSNGWERRASVATNAFATDMEDMGNEDAGTEWAKIEDYWCEVDETITLPPEESTSSKNRYNSQEWINCEQNSDVLKFKVPQIDDFSIDEDLTVYGRLLRGMVGGTGGGAGNPSLEPYWGTNGLANFTIVNDVEDSNLKVITGFETLDEAVADQTVPFNTSVSKLAYPAEIKATVAGETITLPSGKLNSGTYWTQTPAYDQEAAGEYVFTYKIPASEYKLDEGVEPPQVKVTMEKGTLTALNSYETSYRVAQGTSEDELPFPETLSGKVGTTSISDIPVVWTCEGTYDPDAAAGTVYTFHGTIDSFLLADGLTVTDVTVTLTESAEITSYEEPGIWETKQLVPVGTALEDLNRPDTLTATVNGKEVELDSISWESAPEYDGDTIGVYTFSPVLPEGYIWADGVTVPTLQVEVRKPDLSIGTAEELVAFFNNDDEDWDNKLVVLTDDIDMYGQRTNGRMEFLGTFDGQGHRIYNINNNTGGSYLLFYALGERPTKDQRNVEEAVVRNTRFEGGASRAAGAKVIFSTYIFGTVDRCALEWDIYSESGDSAFTSTIIGGSIVNTYAIYNLKTYGTGRPMWHGGFAGQPVNALIENSYIIQNSDVSSLNGTNSRDPIAGRVRDSNGGRTVIDNVYYVKDAIPGVTTPVNGSGTGYGGTELDSIADFADPALVDKLNAGNADGPWRADVTGENGYAPVLKWEDNAGSRTSTPELYGITEKIVTNDGENGVVLDVDPVVQAPAGKTVTVRAYVDGINASISGLTVTTGSGEAVPVKTVTTEGGISEFQFKMPSHRVIISAEMTDKEYPLEITSVADWKKFAEAVNNGHDYAGETVILSSALDFSGVEDLQPVGTMEHPFNGTLSGKVTFKNISINLPEQDNVGLFGVVGPQGNISNLTIQKATVTGKDNVGGLIGLCQGTVDDVTVGDTVNVTGQDKVGGAVGYLQVDDHDLLIDGLTPQNYVTVNGTGRTGIWFGAVHGTKDHPVVMENIGVRGSSINGEADSAGGIIGELKYGELKNSNNYFSTQKVGTVITTGDTAGGLVGTMLEGAVVRDCIAVTTAEGDAVSASENAGGIVGVMAAGAVIENCFAYGDISGGSHAGGLAGDVSNGGVIKNSYAFTGSVTAADGTAGAVTGSKTGEAENTYAFARMAVEGSDAGTAGTETVDMDRILVKKDIYNNLGENWTQEDMYLPYFGTNTNWRIAVPDYMNMVVADYEINTPEELYDLAISVATGATYSGTTFTVGEDLDMNGIEMLPVGATVAFQGSFDGKGHTISNLTIDSAYDYAGLFGQVKGSAENPIVIKDFTLKNARIQAKNRAAAVVAYASNGVSFEDITLNQIDIICSSKNVSAEIGGVVGWYYPANNGKSITGCTVDGLKITAEAGTLGGIGGNVGNADLTDCHVKNAAFGTAYENVGGLAGEISRGTASDCSVTDTTIRSIWDGRVAGVFGTANYYVGGLFGANTGGVTIDSCQVEADIIVESTAEEYGYSAGVGGIMGNANGTTALKGCSFTGSIQAQVINVGGILGSTNTTSIPNINNCYVNAELVGRSKVGGILGATVNNGVSIMNCYVLGSVYASEAYAGGMIGGRGTSEPGTVINNSYVLLSSVTAGNSKASDTVGPFSAIASTAVNDSNNYYYDGMYVNASDTAKSTLPQGDGTVTADQALKAESYSNIGWTTPWTIEEGGLPYFEYSGKVAAPVYFREAVITGFADLTSEVKNQTIAVGTSAALPASLTATIDGTESIIPVIWICEPEYSLEKAGTYTFTAQLGDNYTVEEGVTLPVITVTTVPVYTVTVEVSPAETAVVVKNAAEQTMEANADGSYRLMPGEYTYTATAEGYQTETGSFTVSADTNIVITLTKNGGSSSGGGGGGSSAKPDDGKGETVTNPDGSVTTTTKDETTGSVTETTEYKDGSKFTQITSADGKVQREAVVSEEAVKTAKDGGNPVNVAMPEAEAEKDTAKAPELTIDLPCEEAVVEIPVADIKPGIVAVIVEEDGTEAVVKISEVTEQGLVFSVRDGQKVKIIDNSKIFSDCTDHWAADAIDFAAARELFNGTGANTFSPNRPMTRGMLMTVLARMNDVDTEGGSTWYEKGLLWAVEQGISDGTNPEQKISREQLVTMLYRTAGRPEISGDLGSFSDRAAVSSYAHDAMVWAISQGLIEGTDENQLLPGSDATRAQVATILMRYCAMLLK